MGYPLAQSVTIKTAHREKGDEVARRGRGAR